MYRRIRDLREDHDLDQIDVAKVLGMSQTGYSKYETGENQIPLAVMTRLALLYGTSVDYLLEMTSVKEPYLSEAETRQRYLEYRKKLAEAAASCRARKEARRKTRHKKKTQK